MNLGDICNRNVIVAYRQENLSEAIKLMRQYHVGNLVIVESSHHPVPVGLLTDRDILISAIGAGLNPDEILIEDVMSFELVTANTCETLDFALKTMRARSIKRLPVVDEHNALVGILTIDDIVEILAEALNDIAAITQKQKNRETRKTVATSGPEKHFS